MNRTYVAYNNPNQALTKRYAIYRNGKVIDRKSTRHAAIMRAIFYCKQNLSYRLAMDSIECPQAVARAKQDELDIDRFNSDLAAMR